jgi:hypothetical protein
VAKTLVYLELSSSVAPFRSARTYPDIPTFTRFHQISLPDTLSDNRTLSILNLADNAIGGYYDDGDDFVATPEGINIIVLCVSLCRYSHPC